MIVEIRGRSQITIPAAIIKKLGIVKGDKFEVTEKDGGIFLCPVAVYPKEKIEEIAKIVKEVKSGTSKQKVFENVDDMIADLGIDTDNV